MRAHYFVFAGGAGAAFLTGPDCWPSGSRTIAEKSASIPLRRAGENPDRRRPILHDLAIDLVLLGVG